MIQCGYNQVYSEQSRCCVCVNGYVWIVGECKIPQQCYANAYFNGVRCVCNSGFVENNGRCDTAYVPVPVCGQNSYFNGVSCVCISGCYEIYPGQCGTCSPGTVWNGYQCVRNQTSCPLGYHFDILNNNACVPNGLECGPNAKWNGAMCCCNSGYNLINGVCQSCPFNTYFDGKSCTYNPNGVACPKSNEVWIGGSCVCADGFNRINGDCLVCPPWTLWNGYFCQAEQTSDAWCMGIPHSKKVQDGCQCEIGYMKVEGLCIPQFREPSYSVWGNNRQANWIQH